MVVCKFFLQGTCKFGDYCKFEHQVPGNYTSFVDSATTSTSILRQSNFGAPQAVTKPTNVDTTALVNAVVNDMTQAEKGGQWLFSSYAPFKEKPAFPGFTDQSFEEIRLGFYEAQKNGAVEQYKQQLQAMLQELMTKVKALQNPSPDIINVLKLIYNTPPSSCSGIFGSSNTSTTVFANTGNSSNIFGQQNTGFTQQTNSTSIFAKPSQSIFANAGQTPQQSTSVFGRSASGNTGSIFGSTTQQQNIFAPPSSNASSVFQGNQQQNKTPFAQGQSIFAQAGQGLNKTSSIFGGSQQPTQSVFAQTQQQSGNSPFAQQQPGNSPFAQQQSGNSPFAQQQSTSSPFMQQQSTNIPFAQQQTFIQQQSSNTPFTQQQSGNSPFAQQQSGNSPFTQQQSGNAPYIQQQPGNPPFVQQQPGNTPFAQQQGTVFTQQQSNIFAKPVQQSPIFATPAPNISPMTQAPQPQTGSIFGAQSVPKTNMFGDSQAQLQNQSIFGQNVPKIDTNSALSHSASIFGTNVPQNPTIGQQSMSIMGMGQQESAVDMTIYSKLEELSEAEKKWFESDDLDIMNIPENPPPYELVC